MGALQILMLPQGVNMQMLPQNLSTTYMKHLYLDDQAFHNTKYLLKSYSPSKPSVHAFIFDGLLGTMQGLVAKNEIKWITIFQFIGNDSKIVTKFNLYSFGIPN
jgi:hypothetical protein